MVPSPSPSAITPTPDASSPPAVVCCRVATTVYHASIDSVWQGHDDLVAVGYEVLDSSGPSYRFTAWWSADDGGSWNDARHDIHGPLVVVPEGRGFIGLGYEIYTSPNGHSWRRTGKLPLSPGIQVGIVQDVASVQDGYVAVGTMYVNDEFDSSRAPGVWLSSDGRAWLPLEPLEAPYDAHFDALAAGGPGLVAVGYGGGGPGGLAAVWTSVDGREWSRLQHPAFDDSRTFDIAAWGKRLVVVGALHGGTRPGAWVSEDGVSWTAVEVNNSASAGTEGSVHDIVAVQDGFVASGTQGGAPALWTSADGLDWSAVRLSAATRLALPADDNTTFTSLFVDGDRLVVAGVDAAELDSRFLVGSIGPG